MRPLHNYAVTNNQFRLQYSCHMTVINGNGTTETDAISLYLQGKARIEKRDVTRTVSKATLSECNLSGGGAEDNSFIFKGTFSSVLLPE